MRHFSLLDCLLITSTTAILSDINKIFPFAISEPQIFKAKQLETILLRQFAKVEFVSTHQQTILNQTQQQILTKPEASVNSRVTSEDSHSSGKRTDFPLKF